MSVDTKKKELVGDFKDVATQRLTGAGASARFPHQATPRAVSYGVYDIGENAGWVSVGVESRHGKLRRQCDPPLSSGLYVACSGFDTTIRADRRLPG
jgi:hypothetical protein